LPPETIDGMTVLATQNRPSVFIEVLSPLNIVANIEFRDDCLAHEKDGEGLLTTLDQTHTY
jgi:hypothetical protein